MNYERVTAPVQNDMLMKYWQNEQSIHSFFEYELTEQSFENRAKYLQANTYMREQITDVVRSYMERYEMTDAIERNLDSLKAGAFVVAGGQQAGLLTGPLFSVYKAISVILLAKEQQEKLQHPVVPLFWIAGEDHDVDEINHTFVIEEDTVQKRIFGGNSKGKHMASRTVYDKAQLKQFVDKVFAAYGETEYTYQMLQVLYAQVEANDTYTEFFAAIMNYFFAEHGLLLIDAAYESLRQLEAPFFERIVAHNESLSKSIVEQENAFVAAGYNRPLEAKEQNANIFYVKDGERYLLERKDGFYFNGLGAIKLTEVELLAEIAAHPERFSNNVATRPLMQDYLFPVLAFVGGPGELAYWATLKHAFHIVGMQMPIFMPRLSMTIVDRQAQHVLQARDLTVSEVLKGEVSSKLSSFLASKQDEDLQKAVDAMQQTLLTQYEALEELLDQKVVKIERTVERNKAYHKQQFAYLKKKLQEDVQSKYDVTVKQYRLAEHLLLPNGKPQERIYNPFQFLNSYGPSFVEQLLNLDYEMNGDHYAVYL